MEVLEYISSFEEIERLGVNVFTLVSSVLIFLSLRGIRSLWVQIQHIISRHSVQTISFIGFACLFLQFGSYLLYGLEVHRGVMIFQGLCRVPLLGIVLALIFHYKHRLEWGRDDILALALLFFFVVVYECFPADSFLVVISGIVIAGSVFQLKDVLIHGRGVLRIGYIWICAENALTLTLYGLYLGDVVLGGTCFVRLVMYGLIIETYRRNILIDDIIGRLSPILKGDVLWGIVLMAMTTASLSLSSVFGGFWYLSMVCIFLTSLYALLGIRLWDAPQRDTYRRLLVGNMPAIGALVCAIIGAPIAIIMALVGVSALADTRTLALSESRS